MAETVPPADAKGIAERIPVMQRVLDNTFLLLFIGITVPAVFYVVWGVMELIKIPVAK